MADNAQIILLITLAMSIRSVSPIMLNMVMQTWFSTQLVFCKLMGILSCFCKFTLKKLYLWHMSCPLEGTGIGIRVTIDVASKENQENAHIKDI